MSRSPRVLFVCMGNICRSPTLAGVLTHLVATSTLPTPWVVESAGTHAYHIGEEADPRTVTAAGHRGVDLSSHRARLIRREDFDRFDEILCMDESNLKLVRRMGPWDAPARIGLALDYAPQAGRTEVPDPYYGDARDFERVVELAFAVSRGLIAAYRDGRRLTAPSVPA
jgi:protein-tyrosine phosphatase